MIDSRSRSAAGTAGEHRPRRDRRVLADSSTARSPPRFTDNAPSKAAPHRALTVDAGETPPRRLDRRAGSGRQIVEPRPTSSALRKLPPKNDFSDHRVNASPEGQRVYRDVAGFAFGHASLMRLHQLTVAEMGDVR